MISITLGILNLLPVPILDGGHLALFFIEWVRGKPLSQEAQAKLQRLGLILLLMLMSLAFFNDLSRLFG
jgi:regulator of sigma E protease